MASPKPLALSYKSGDPVPIALLPLLPLCTACIHAHDDVLLVPRGETRGVLSPTTPLPPPMGEP